MTDEEYLKECLKFAAKSNDPSMKVGSVIVRGGEDPYNRIIGYGWNSFPKGIKENERILDRETKLKIIVHAEMNAILQAAKEGIKLKDTRLYVASFDAKEGTIFGGCPCTRCTVELIQTGIREVISYPFDTLPPRWREDISYARTLLEEAGVEYREVDG